jgi:peptide/nickel transport system permease protein
MSQEKKPIFKGKAGQYMKFLLIPGYKSTDLQIREYEIGKLKSKRKFFRRLLTPLSITGFILLSIIVTLAVFSPWLTSYTVLNLTQEQYIGIFEPPSVDHPFGQTKNGWDILGRLIWGARVSLTVGLIALSIGIGVGVPLGIIAAYFGGVVESIIMRISDMFRAFPGMILALVFVAIWGLEIENIMLAFGILAIPGYIRAIRGSALQVKQNLYIKASKAAGLSNFNIMFKHILPNSINPIIIALSFDLGNMVMMLTSLSFFGYNDPTLISWGRDISDSRGVFYYAPHTFIFPAIVIFITVLGFILLGDGIRDALDPKLKFEN